MTHETTAAVPDSRVLILVLSSKTQQTGGASAYGDEDTMVARLPENQKAGFIRARRSLWQQMVTAREREHGRSVAEHVRMDGLREGRDLGGEDPGARYLPAVDRYAGRFFMALGDEGREMLRAPRYHVILLSNIYGLVWPTEPIQVYSSPVRDELGEPLRWIYDTWNGRGHVLTSALRAYIAERRITALFDLTADPQFQELVSWDKLAKVMGLSLLRCWGTRSAGPDSLPAFGHLTRSLLSKSEDELLSIRAGDRADAVCEEVIFGPASEEPPPGALSYQPETRDWRDHIARARQGVVELVRRMEGPQAISQTYRPAVGKRIGELQRRGALTSGVEHTMRGILCLRNRVAYDGYSPRAEDLKGLRTDCMILADLADRQDLGHIEELRIP